MKRNDKGLLILCLFNFVIGQVSLFGIGGVGLPFFLAGVPFYKSGIVAAFLMLMGCYLGQGISMAFINGIIVFCILLCRFVFSKKNPLTTNRLHNIKVYSAIGTITYMLLEWIYNKKSMDITGNPSMTINAVVNTLAQGIALCGMIFLFNIGINYIVKCMGIRKPSLEELISMVLILLVSLKAVNPLFSEVFLVELTVIFLLILMGGYLLGSGAGALIGVLGAVVYNIGIDSPNFEKMLVMTGIFALIGGVCGALCSIHAFLGSLGMITLVMGFFYVMGRDVSLAYMFSVSTAGAGISGAFLFGIFSLFVTKKEKKYEDKYEPRAAKYLTARRLKDYSMAFERLSESFEKKEEKREVMSRNDMENIFRLLSENVCNGCEKVENCWGDNYYITYGDTLDVIDDVWQNGKSSKISGDFSTKCKRIETFVMQVEMAVEVARLNLRWLNKIRETKEAFRNQFKEVATVMDNVSLIVDKPDYFSVKEKQKIVDNLESMGLEVRDIFGVPGPHDRVRLVVECKTRINAYITTKGIKDALGFALGREFTVADGEKLSVGREFSNYSFYEATNYKVITGVARVAKSGERDNGDNYSFTNPDNGEVVMLLCDGMGSGTSASMQSKKVIELMENLMEAGFTWKSAVSFVNCVYAWGEEAGDIYSMDIALINLYTGTCSFVKEGAFATFIKRKNWVESISSASLPGGVFVGNQWDVVEKKLYNGDYVIMVSDGVGNSLPQGKEIETMEKIISEIETTNPSLMASRIIEKCVEYNEYVANDDMTVLVLSIWNK